jgi:EAL domain-containing protein (putative c-di-GMP-specific phosphodiesterase class I)
MTLNNKTDINNYKVLLLIDILNIYDINSIYGFKNGQSIIKQMNQLFEEKILYLIDDYLISINMPNIFMKFSNLHTDVFSFKIYKKLNDRISIKIKNIILTAVRYHKFYVKNYDVNINIDVTIGCSQSNDKNLLTYALKALNHAKESYSSYSYFDSIFFKNELINCTVFDKIKLAIEDNTIEPYFQKIINSKTNQVYKYESLMRIQQEDGVILTPNVFLEKSKKYRLYPQLMHIMITKVFNYVKIHQVDVSINLDYNDLVGSRMQDNMLAILEKENIGKFITIEILESEKIHNFDLINEFIRNLKQYNVKIAIDDFGSGFSNYENILKLDIDYIKLDGSLVQKIHEDIYFSLIKSIVSFAKEQQIGIIAEFVSDVSIFRRIKALGINFAQGYYLGKPVHIKELINE